MSVENSSDLVLDDTTLESEFAFIREAEFNHVKGIWYVDSYHPGPILGITIHTHGNEPSGLAALWYFRNKFPLGEHIKKGSIFFVLNNIEATEKYFEALKMVEDTEEQWKMKDLAKRNARSSCLNMNRLPSNTMETTSDGRYEIRRAQELRGIWRLFDVGFDIHSGAQKIEPVIIACGGLLPELISGFPISKIITNIENVQKDKPAVSFYGTRGTTKTIAIETGSHEEPSSFACAIACCHALLRNLGMLDGSHSDGPRDYEHFQIVDSISFPNTSFELIEVLKWYVPIIQGQILARGKNESGDDIEIRAPFDGHALMGPKDSKPNSIDEEVLFLSLPVIKLTI